MRPLGEPRPITEAQFGAHKELHVSLHTIVSDGLAGRLPARRVSAAAVVRPTPSNMAARLSGASMRVLETGLALTAIATALLIGLGR
jgi:hypothetical protein